MSDTILVFFKNVLNFNFDFVGLICLNQIQAARFICLSNQCADSITCVLPSRLRLQNTPTVFLQRGKTPPPPTSVQDMTFTIWWWGFSNAGPLGNAKYPLMPSLPGLLWPWVIAPDRVLSMGQIELFDSKSECKQMTYARLNCLK